MTVARTFQLAALLLAAFVAVSCGKDSASTTTPDTTVTTARSNEVFTGTLGLGELQFYSFVTAVNGSTEVTLVSMRPAGVPTATVSTVVGLGLGTPAGTGCALSSATTTGPGLSAQVTVSTSVNTYCVAVSDVGNLTRPQDFAIRILHP